MVERSCFKVEKYPLWCGLGLKRAARASVGVDGRAAVVWVFD